MTYLTMLNSMLSKDLDVAVAKFQELGLKHLDLKDSVFGRSIEGLDAALNDRLAELIQRTRMDPYCFSSVLGHVAADRISEQDFRKGLKDGVDHLLATAKLVKPTMIRLLACKFDNREDWSDCNEFFEKHAPWVYGAYREEIERVAAAGVLVTIENEPRSAFCNPQEIVEFYERLGCGAKARYTWDVQNMWQSGVYPTVEAYNLLKPVINYVHLKGGMSKPETPRMMSFRCPLEDATWPVQEIMKRVIADDVSPVICLNTSHGRIPDNYKLKALAGTSELGAEEARRDVIWLRANFPEIR